MPTTPISRELIVAFSVCYQNERKRHIIHHIKPFSVIITKYHDIRRKVNLHKCRLHGFVFLFIFFCYYIKSPSHVVCGKLGH